MRKKTRASSPRGSPAGQLLRGRDGLRGRNGDGAAGTSREHLLELKTGGSEARTRFGRGEPVEGHRFESRLLVETDRILANLSNKYLEGCSPI